MNSVFCTNKYYEVYFLEVLTVLVHIPFFTFSARRNERRGSTKFPYSDYFTIPFLNLRFFFFNSPHVLNVDQFILLKYGCSGLETYPKPIHNPVPFLKCCTYLKKNNCSSKMQKIHILPSEI
jgi:hypothetical protein